MPTGTGVNATQITFIASTTIKSADVNSNFTNINNSNDVDAATINGRSLYVGAGAPSGSLGVIGDIYYRTS